MVRGLGPVDTIEPVGPSVVVRLVLRPMTKMLNDVTQPRIMSRQEAKPLVQSAFSPPERAGFRMLGIGQVMVLQVASAGHAPGAAATANAG